MFAKRGNWSVVFANFYVLSTTTMAISSDQCDVTKSRVVKRCVQQDPILQYFHHTDIIDVTSRAWLKINCGKWIRKWRVLDIYFLCLGISIYLLEIWHNLTFNSSYAAAAKSLQSCPTLCDPIDGSPPGSPVPGILQARTLEWIAISFSSYVNN